MTSPSRLVFARPACVFAILLTAVGCRTSPLDTLATARDLSSDLLVQFTVAADASSKAVMAEALDASTTFAQQAERAKTGVQDNVAALGAILAKEGYGPEHEMLQQFAAEFEKYKELDRQILDLTIENSNRKAEQLSYVQGQQHAESFRHSLQTLKPRRDGDQWQVKALALEAIAAVREIVALQPLHIGESSDPAMAGIEERIEAAGSVAHKALATLDSFVADASRADLASAGAALDRFMATNEEILALSRRNTNVRSRALTLTDKGRLTAACEGRLVALRAALAKRGTAGTR